MEFRTPASPLEPSRGKVVVPASKNPVGKRKKKKIVLFQRQAPILRLTADATLKRPPRITYGYCMVSGSNRSYAYNSADVCAERLLFVENWCGSHEQSLACLAQGHGFHGHHIADLVVKSLPSVLSQCAVEVAFRPRDRSTLSGTVAGTGTGRGGNKEPRVEFITQPRDKILAAARLMAKAAGVGEDGKGADVPTGRQPTPGTTEYTAAKAERTVAQQRMVEVVQAAFQKLHQGLLEEQDRGTSRLDIASSGTSLLVCIVRGKALLLAGAGLCRAVLGREVDGRELKDAVLAARQPTKTGTGGHAGLAMLRQFAEDSEAKHDAHLAMHEAAARQAAEHGLGSTNALSVLPRLKYFTTKDGRQITRSGLKFTTHEAKHGIGTAVPTAERPLLSGVYNRSSAMARLTHLISESAIVDTSAKDLSKGALDPEEEQRRKVLHSDSMPTFPDLPPVIERALQFKEETYLKPSSLLQAKRAELVKLMTAKAELSEREGSGGGEPDLWASASGPLRRTSPLRVLDSANITTTTGEQAVAHVPAQPGNMGSAGELGMLGSATRRSVALARELRAALAVAPRPAVPALKMDILPSTGGAAGVVLGTVKAVSTAKASGAPVKGGWGSGTPGARTELSQPSFTTTVPGEEEAEGEEGQDRPPKRVQSEDSLVRAETGREAVRLAMSSGKVGADAVREGEIVTQALDMARRAHVSASRHVMTSQLNTKSITEEEMRLQAYPELDPSAGPIDYSVPPPEFESTSLGQGVVDKYQPMKDDLQAIRIKTTALSTGSEHQALTRSLGGGNRSILRKSAGAGGMVGSGMGLPGIRPDMGERIIATGVRDLMGMRGVTLDQAGPPEEGLSNFKGSTLPGRRGKEGYPGYPGSGLGSGLGGTAGQPLDKTIDLQSRLTQELAEARMFDEQGRPVRVVVPVALVSEHRPDRPDESSRVHIAGGRVSSGHLSGGARGGIPRVFGPHMEGPGLATSRCLGYTSATQFGVICEPEVVLRVVQPADRFVILGSEGLWAVLSSTEAVDIVSHTLNAILWGGTAEGEYRRMAEEARAKMAKEAKGSNRHSASAEEGEDEAEGSDVEEDGAELQAHSGSAFASLRDVLKPIRAPPAGLSHPAIQAVTLDPGLGARPALPGIAHPSPSVHVTPTPATEMVVQVSPGQAPVAGAGSGSDSTPMDLLDSFIPPLARARRADRLRRVAIAAAEALVGAAKGKWAQHVAKYVAAAEDGGRTGLGMGVGVGGGSATPVTRPEHIIHQDISVLVVLLDHA